MLYDQLSIIEKELLRNLWSWDVGTLNDASYAIVKIPTGTHIVNQWTVAVEVVQYRDYAPYYKITFMPPTTAHYTKNIPAFHGKAIDQPRSMIRKHFYLYLPKDIADKLADLPGQSQSQFVSTAITEALQRAA